jgi:hypothetical protein
LNTALDVGTDPNAIDGDGFALLMCAVIQNHFHMVNVLLSRGANIHQRGLFDWTALHLAVYRDDVFRKIFSEAGPCAMNFKDCIGWTPLHCLAHYGSAEHMAFALSHPGIDVSIRCHEGRTPLEVSKETNLQTALQTYGAQESRWRPRYTWIKFLISAMMRVS